jgi:hypothetical protein
VLLGAVVLCAIPSLVVLARPPRVLLIGDSITGQYGPSAAATLRHHGYDPVVSAYPGVGLLDRGPRIDAPAVLSHKLGAIHARVVVAEFSGNYGIVDPALPGVTAGSGAFLAVWQDEVASLTHQGTQDGAYLIWLLAPPPIRGSATVSDQLSTVYERTQKGRVTALDPSPAVALLDRNGDLYGPDGRHLSDNGVTLIAHLVARSVEAHSQWRLRLGALWRSSAAVVLAAVAVVGLAALAAALHWSHLEDRARRSRA